MGFLLTFAVVYGLANLYIGNRFFYWLKTIVTIPQQVYWIVFILAAAAPIISRVLARTGVGKAESLFIVGDWWLAVTYWSVLLWLIVDIIKIADKRLGFLSAVAKDTTNQGYVVIFILLGMLVYGAWNAQNPVVTRYDISINKKAAGMNNLKIVLVSDIHMGRVVGTDRVERLAESLNQLNPDIVLYAGDQIDDDVEYVAKNNIAEPLRNVKARFGSYAVLGNHEYIGGQPALAVSLLKNNGITVLQDQWIKIGDAIYIVGRDDVSAARYAARGTKTLAEIMKDIDRKQTIILMDHQPSRLNEAVQQGVDLQVSGHTHRGQFSPNNIITQRIYEQDWGYLKKDAYQLIVSCGYGTWGPPIRLGNQPEIVEINIAFDD
ncbi:MAG: metallophosphoesterase [Veillonellaceae bacterium]|nr:metallophosphoesterase [Veillonellaceae bacterium]